MYGGRAPKRSYAIKYAYMYVFMQFCFSLKPLLFEINKQIQKVIFVIIIDMVFIVIIVLIINNPSIIIIRRY